MDGERFRFFFVYLCATLIGYTVMVMAATLVFALNDRRLVDLPYGASLLLTAGCLWSAFRIADWVTAPLRQLTSCDRPDRGEP